jgi:hypothetical protein
MEDNRLTREENALKKIIKYVLSSHNYKNSDTLFVEDIYDSVTEKLFNYFNSKDENFYKLLSLYHKRNRCGYYFRNLLKEKNILEIFNDKINNDSLDQEFKNNLLFDLDIEIKTLRYLFDYIILNNKPITINNEINTDFYLEKKYYVFSFFKEEEDNDKKIKFKTKIEIYDKEYDIYRFCLDFIKGKTNKYYEDKSLDKKVKKILKNEIELIKSLN